MVKYGERCRNDSECKSDICEMAYDELNNPKERLCVIQSKKWGKECALNSDCISNRCELTFDKYRIPDKKRCVIIDGLKKKAEKSMFNEDDLPESVRMDEQTKKVSQEKVILNPHQKALAFEGRGPIATVVCTIIEFFLKLFLKILQLLYDIWFGIFKSIWNLLFGGFDGLIPDIPGKYKTCHNSFYFRYFITILFPPAGIFMSKGITGFFQIMVCCALTLMFYFPGLVYAIIIMRGSRHSDLCKKV